MKKTNKKGNVFGIIAISVVCLIVLVALAFVFEVGGLKWKEYFGTKHANVDREIFEESKSRVQGAIQDISRKQLESSRAEDDVEKRAICDYLVNAYVDLDSEKINSVSTKQFFENCRRGIIQ